MSEQVTTATKSTQRVRIMLHLRTGKTLTSLEALREYGIARLSARISELKRRGEPIAKEMIEVQNKYGETVRVAEYRLKESNAETPYTTPVDGQNAAADISRRGQRKQARSGKDAPTVANKTKRSKHMENIELFNLQDGAAFVSRAEREQNPGAEYFTAQIETRHVGRVLPRWEPDEVKNVTLTFRKTDKPEEGKQSAIVTEDGMTMLCDYAEAAENVEIIGVLVRSVLSFVG